MDDALRNGLWNAATVALWDKLKSRPYRNNETVGDFFFNLLWLWHYRQPVDEIPYSNDERVKELRQRYFKWNWYEVYDFIEFAAQRFPEGSSLFMENCNVVLEKELSAYRFSGKDLIPITSDQELAAIEESRTLSDIFSPVRLHIQTAVDLFSDRTAPDYRNSIKESISAVEAICNIITGSSATTLGQALKELEKKGIVLHAALKSSFSSLYGYTSDAQGIRHALMDDPTLDFDDAKFMLVSCSGFVNYLAAKSRTKVSSS